MFGKKKNVMVQAGAFRCGVCGIDCSDLSSFERHVSWAHSGTQTPKVENKEDKKQ
jgi:hypothetical protein